MKNVKNILWIAVALIFVTACSEDFLERKPTSFINNDELGETAKVDPDVMNGVLNGVYTLMITPGAGGTSSHEDFGQKTFDIISDLLSNDLALVSGAYNRWVALASFQWTPDFKRTIPNYIAWRYYYKIIKASNNVIASLGGNDANPEKIKTRAALGQAKALRAYAYFYLSQFYATEYNPDAPLVPIYTEIGEPAKPQAKASEVYDLMISDLKSAIELLKGFDRGSSKTFINQNVAKGLLAYVYASMGTSETNKLAKQMADEVIDSGEFTLMSSAEVTGGFNSVKTPGWMWGFDVTKSNGLNLISWWGMMGYYCYSYQAAGNYKGIDSDLYARIKNTDIRKQQFGDYVGEYGKGGHFEAGKGALMPMNKFYNDVKKPMGQREIIDDYVYMRVAEMYLLSAEMSAVEGDEAAAKTRLKELLAQRFTDAKDYAYLDKLQGNGLLDEILFQTRIELLAEGKSYFLMKRRKMVKTRGQNHLNFKGESFDYNDPKLSFKIPEKEVQNNPYIN